MLISCLVFILFVLLVIAYELHFMTERLIEIGTIVEHFNRRELRASGIADAEDDDFASESIRKTHHAWKKTLWAIIVFSIFCSELIKMLGR